MGLFYGHILLLHALKDLSSMYLPLKQKFLKNPVMIVYIQQMAQRGDAKFQTLPLGPYLTQNF